MKGKIFITRRLPGSAVAMLKKTGLSVSMYPRSDRAIPRAELLRKVKGCTGIISLLTDKMNDQVFGAAGPQLRVVSNYAVGYDNIDVAEAAKRKIKVGNTPCDEVSEAVSEAAMTMILACATKIIQANNFTKAGKYKTWDPLFFNGPSLVGKTLGIVGLGRIGSGLAHRAADGFGLNIVYFDLTRRPEFEKRFNARYLTIEQLLRRSDFISLHVPLLKSTYHLISTKQLKMMKKSAYLINTSRGPVVDELALLKALKKKEIAGAALDVYECEPAIDCIPSDSMRLKDFDNVIMTPHTASATTEAREKMAMVAAENIIAALRGRQMPGEVIIKT